MRTNLLNDLSNVLKKGTSLSEKGTSLNLLPKMDRECIGNDSRMDRQSLGKIFRYAAMITLLLTLVCGNVWGDTEITISPCAKADKDDYASSCYFVADGTAISNIVVSGGAGNEYNNGSPKISVQGIPAKKEATLTFTISSGVKITSFKAVGTSASNTTYDLDGSSVTIGTALTSLNKTGSMVFKLTCTDATSSSTNRKTTLTSFVLEYTSASTARTFKSGEKIYFKDANNNFDFGYLWKVASGNVYAWFMDGGSGNDRWSTSYGVPVEGNYNEKGTIYELVVPQLDGVDHEWGKILFTRGSYPAWDSQTWNKTTDETPEEGKNLFYVDNVTEHKIGQAYSGSWGNFTPAGKTIYFDNRNVDGWTTAYVRIGHGEYNSKWDMTKVAGTKCLYTATTDKFSSHTEFSVANSYGWTDKNNIVQPWSGQSWSAPAKITKQTNYQQYAIEKDIYICPQATSVSEYDCQYYTVDGSSTSSHTDANKVAATLPSYSVTYSGTNCTVAVVKYTNDAGSSTSALSSGSTVDPTRIIKVTVTPNTGYQFSAVEVTGVGTITAAAAGTPGVYYVTDNATISATCTCIDFTPARGGTADGVYTVGADGGTLTCSVAAAGTYTYKWKQYTLGQGVGDAVDAVGTGATSTSFTPHPTVAGTYYYFCEVTNSCDVKKTTSTSGTFVFNAAVTLYTVTYNVNGGGSVTPTNETQASSGASVTLPTPTWSGYTFDGWYNAGTEIGKGGASYTPTADITLYAHWTDNISGKVFSFIDNNYGDKFKSFTGYGWVAKDSTGRSKTFTNASTGVEYRVSAAGWDKKNNAISALAKFLGGTSSMSIVIPTGKIATVKISYNAYGTGDDYRLTVNSTAQANPSTKLADGNTNAQVISNMKEITLNNQTGTLTLGISNTGKNNYIGRVSAVITGYTVSYAAGTYGSGSLASGTKTHGSNFTLSSSDNAFTRDGYTYDGWSTNADGSTKDYNLGGSYTTDAPVTLYPHWVGAASISATLESDEYMRIGAAGMQLSISITGASSGWYYRVKETSTGYQNPDMTTYTTTSWTMTSTIGAATNNYVVELYDGSNNKMATSNTITVYGETGHPMTIAAGAGGSASPASTWANGNHLHPEITATPSDGYHFVNWTKNNENATLANENAATTTITNASGACTITANFEADVVGYTVTYKYNGATSGASPESATGTSVTLPNPTRTGYVLDGWYTTAGEKVEDGGETYNPTADITLYARWEEECDAEGVAKSTADVPATGYTTYIEKGGDKVVFTAAPTLGFKYKDAAGNTINNSKTDVVRNNAYKCQISSDSGNKGSIKTNSTFSNVDSISFYFAASDKGGCKIAVWCSTDNFSTDSTSLLSATTYADNNSEFKLKTLAIPSDKKASALRFKFRFTVGSSGKTSYIDSLKVYSSTSGGGTCYHVYYHGNGAESGYVNDTVSYTAGSKATVLNYNYGRYPLAKTGYDFRGWATSASGAVAYSAGQKIDITSADVDLYAVWVAESDALVTWEKKVNVTTWTDNTTPSTTDPTNIGTIGSSATLIDSPSSNSTKTPQIQLASGASNADKGASFTFSMKSADKVVVPTKVSCEVANVGGDSNGDITYKAVLTDGAGNTYYSTNSICPNNNGTLNPIDFVFSSGLSLRGDITVKVYAWLSGSGSEFSFRMGPDVKFYGTVEDYTCATPAAPTISGVSEYVPGQTITLTASHDGENYDNLTTYTWYKGDTWGSKSKVQNAATGSAGYTFTKASCAAGDAGKYWCEVSNGTGCDAHNSEGYDVTVYPTYTITYNLNEGAWGEVEHKDSYTQFDEDYTLPTPTKTGSVFAGWYGASDFSGLPTVVLGAGSVGNKEYWAKWGETVTVSWTVTKVDDKLYRGGGGYSVKAVINEDDWSTGFMDELELTATEGVTLKNIVASVNGESKVQVTADFDITTDLAADATSITFTLNVPADGKYGPKVDEHEEDLDDCGGGASGYTEFFSMIPKANTCSITHTEANSAPNHFTTCECTSSATITAGGSVTYGLYSSGTGTTSKYWEYNGGNGGWKHSIANSWVVLYSTEQFKAGDSIVITNGNSSNSGYYTIVASASNNTADYHSVSRVAAPSTTTPAKNTNYYYKLPASFVSSNYLVIRSSTTSSCYVGTIKAYHAGASGGITPTLSWDDGDVDIATTGIAKNTSDNDFIYTARQDKNSLGAITYSSSDATVATVNATTGQVHLVGAAGTATITATIAASGCFSSANVSYTITVTDDCDDEAGTIETEDLGCSGVKMTITGHTAAAGVIYQWYKVGTPSDATVGTNQDNFTATEAGSYYVIVTNTGDRHCAKRSTNTITVEAQAAATVTKIVDSWYVKNGRRTPDIELVKTTNATSFTVTNKGTSAVIWNSDSTVKTGFGGCGFHLGENGIIYLNGTKDNGDAPSGLTGDADVTLTITAIGCGGNQSKDITIHCQAATNYKEIAFVADGGKGMKKDSITVGHGDGTELYEYLDSVGTAAENRLFKLSERNIYWTTDEKAIREEYSQFDAILITDDPSTNTVVKDKDDYKTKGYVNAFGTMVDVRPIFTMEAYVSALTNWGSKGIAGNPESPNPRQYEMRLECKDHEIYGAGLPDPEDGTNVWEEVIDGETFRHVILVDSTKGVYKGVAYNAETAGNKKPALQGFTGEAAGSLLGLGRILEGTLQAAIERQEEPAARLLVMGINAKALQPTCALTNEGKTVIKNILVYLLKTNMEEVDDCSNYFTGKNGSDWNNASNWSKNQLPSSEAKVRILAPCVISGVQPHVAQVAIVSSGKSSIRETATGLANCNGKLTINADGALIVGGKVRAADAPHFAANDLKPTTVEDLVLNTSSTNQAALIFDNDEGKTQATVKLYSLGRKVSETNQFQYFAIPMSYLSVNPTFANETHGITIYTYVWLEATGWERRGYYTDLYAFEGIGITTNETTAHEYTMKGTLASTKDQEIPITADGKKLNLIGNSWTAPIQISELEASDFGDASSAVEQTVYIYCAGHGKETADGETEAAGQWLAIPFEAARFAAWDGLKVIPSMQAFQIKTTGEGTLTLDYDKHVRGGSTDLTAKLRAPQRRAAHDGVELMRIRVADSKTHTDLYLFEGDQFSDAFDNGWEANYRVGTNESAKLYARVATGVMSVAAMSDLEGTPIYFIPGQETEYTFTFGGNGMGYYLNDLKLQQSTLISEGAEYSFTYEKGDAAARFMISATPYESPQVTTGTENVQTEDKPRKILYNNKLYIIYNGHVYSADGAIVK